MFNLMIFENKLDRLNCGFLKIFHFILGNSFIADLPKFGTFQTNIFIKNPHVVHLLVMT